MAKSKFDTFMNQYDQKTEGKYTYYYRKVWDSCQFADDCYKQDHIKSIWENTVDHDEWVRHFRKGMRARVVPEKVRESIEDAFVQWIKSGI